MVSMTAIKARRMTRGKTQRAVAEGIGITEQAFWAVETGYIPASDNMQEKVANYFDCERSELFDPDTRRAIPFAL